MKQRIPWAAWLLPIFFGILGGLIGFIAFYHREGASRLIVAGIISTVVWWLCG